MILQRILSISGLVLNIIGVLILYKYGLTSNIDKEGTIFIADEDHDEKEKGKWVKFYHYSQIALVLLIIGFVFQLVAVILSF